MQEEIPRRYPWEVRANIGNKWQELARCQHIGQANVVASALHSTYGCEVAVIVHTHEGERQHDTWSKLDAGHPLAGITCLAPDCSTRVTILDASYPYCAAHQSSKASQAQ